MKNFVYTSIAEIVLFLRGIKLFMRDEKKGKTKKPFFQKLKYYTKGFLSQSVDYYNLNTNNHKEYISDWYRYLKVGKINLCHNDLVNDKFLFHDFFRNNEKVVRPIAFIKNKTLIDFETKKEISVASVKSLNVDLVIKPQKGGRGDDIHLIKKGTNESNEIEELISSGLNYVIQKRIIQDGLPHKINPNSLNTLRVLTMIDPTTKEPFIAKTIQRFGTLKSNFVDNFSVGGIVVDTDMHQGVYKKGAILNDQNQIEYLSKHPDTEVIFEGESIKNWSEIKRVVLEMSKELNQLKHLGWDVIPLSDGFMILEANSNSDVNLLQLFGGLLKNVRIKRFYRDNSKTTDPECVFRKLKARYNL